MLWPVRPRGIQLVSIILLATRVSSLFATTRRGDTEDLSGAARACQLLKEDFPQLVSFPGDEQYALDNDMFYVSSEQNSTCSVQPRSVEDVNAIIQMIGRPDVRAPFAVKSGGHGYNLGQSSTPGVQISMAQFTNLNYDAEKKTVSVGVGLTWGQVYDRLEPLGVMVAGGRIAGVGVGGYSLGGGYSWKSNQYGLLIDTVVSLELVLPSGELVHVTNVSNPDLFFALKGGLNNFGIVTEITLEAHEQTLVFGGSLLYSVDAIESLNTAVSDFSRDNTDPKAQIIAGYGSLNNQFAASIMLFYDARTPPPGVYDAIVSVPYLSSNVKTQPFAELVSGFGQADYGIGPFGAAQHVVPILRYTRMLLDEMVTQVKAFAARITEQNNGTTIAVSIAAEPFFNAFSHSRGGAYPHLPSRQVTPAAFGIAYQEDLETPIATRIARQADFVKEMKSLTRIIQARAVEEGVSRWDDILYPNYALPDTPLELLYGSNVQRLRALAAKYDPERVMALTGGFRFQD